MGLVARKTQTLEDFFRNELNTLYGLEVESRSTLRKMAHAATAPSVQNELTEAVRETEIHAARLDQLFDSINMKPDQMRCGCVDGLLRDCRDAAESDGGANLIDASLVAMARTIQQNEIVRYQTAHGWAQSLKHDEARSLLKQTLDEETVASSRLADLAATVNESALEDLLA